MGLNPQVFEVRQRASSYCGLLRMFALRIWKDPESIHTAAMEVVAIEANWPEEFE